MKLRLFVLFFLIVALFGNAYAGDKFSLHLACSPGRQCIDLAGENGIKESVEAAPVIEFGQADIAAASVQRTMGDRLALNILLSPETSKKFEIITRENIGKKLIVAFDNLILTAPTIQAPISGSITIGNTYGGNASFWKNSSWLEGLIKASNQTVGHSIRIYAISAFVIVFLAIVFVLVPRFKRTHIADLEE
jgi:hypothetical protein